MVSNCDLLKGKTALITGCNRGIGKAILEVFADNGASVIACSRHQEDEHSRYLTLAMNKYKVPITPLYFELTSETEIKECLKPLVQQRLRIDILVNNAGIAHGNFFQMTSIQTIRNVFEINFFSQLIITQQISRVMIKQGSGNIINLASIAGIDADAGNIAYGSSKAAFIYATKTLAKEFAQYNIRVNAIAPGLTDTDMATLMEPKARSTMVQNSAINRMALPLEIANTALFLASDLSSFITGQIIRVDGGN